MERNICLIGFGSKQNVYILIIQALVKEWPLSTAALYKRLTQKYSYPISYQGVHKIIRKMGKNQILEKSGKYYKINIQWLDKLNTFSSETKRAYTEGNGKLEFPM